MAVIQVSGLSKRYHKQEVLRTIDLTIQQGELIGYIGPNGAGKSTTIKILCGLIPDFEGDVNVLGMDWDIGNAPEAPSAPETLQQTGLTLGFLSDMVLRTLYVRGGMLGNTAIDASQLTRLATLPSREVLLGKLAGGMAAPMTGMAAVLAANIRNLVGVLSALADKKQQTQDAA